MLSMITLNLIVRLGKNFSKYLLTCCSILELESHVIQYLENPYKITGDREKIPKLNTWTISNGKIINKIKISSSPFVNLRAAGIKGGETLTYFFFSLFLVFLWEIGQWDGKWEDVKKETTLEAANLVGKRRERDVVSAIEKRKQMNWKRKELEAKACKEVVLTLKLIINVFFTMSFIID